MPNKPLLMTILVAFLTITQGEATQTTVDQKLALDSCKEEETSCLKQNDGNNEEIANCKEAAQTCRDTSTEHASSLQRQPYNDVPTPNPKSTDVENKQSCLKEAEEQKERCIEKNNGDTKAKENCVHEEVVAKSECRSKYN